MERNSTKQPAAGPAPSGKESGPTLKQRNGSSSPLPVGTSRDSHFLAAPSAQREASPQVVGPFRGSHILAALSPQREASPQVVGAFRGSHILASLLAQREVRREAEAAAADVPDETPTREAAQKRQVISEMESAFGCSFSAVRLRTDDAAAMRAQSLGASAYTEGNEIGFAEGAFAPESSAGRSTLAHEFAHIAQRQLATVDGAKSEHAHDEGEYEGDAEAAADAVMRGIRPTLRPAVFQIAMQHVIGKGNGKKKQPKDSPPEDKSPVPSIGHCYVEWTGRSFILTFPASDIAAAEDPNQYIFRAYLNRAFSGLSEPIISATVQRFSGACVEKPDGKCYAVDELKKHATARGKGTYRIHVVVRLHRAVSDWLAENYKQVEPARIVLGDQPIDAPAVAGDGTKKESPTKDKSSSSGIAGDSAARGTGKPPRVGGDPSADGSDVYGWPRFVPKAHLELRPNLLRQVAGAEVGLTVVFEEAGGPYNVLMNVFPERAHFDWSVYEFAPNGNSKTVDTGPWFETGAREYNVSLNKCQRCVIEVLVTSESFRPGTSLLLRTAPIEVISEAERSVEVFDAAFVGAAESKPYTRGPNGQLQLKPGQKPVEPKDAIDAFDRELGAIDELVKQGQLAPDQAARAKELRQQAKGELQKIETQRQGQEPYHVSATFVSREDGQSIPLTLYLHRTRRSISNDGFCSYAVLLFDTTLDPTNPTRHPGTYPSELYELVEARDPVRSERGALEAMADHWHHHNDYPKGTVRLAVQLKEQPGQIFEQEINTGNWRKPLKKVLAYGSMGLGVLALAATPFTGGSSTAVGVLLIGSASTGLAAMALDIEDRIQKEGTLKADTRLLLDIVGLAGTLLGLGALSQTLRSARLVAQTRYLIALGTSDLAQGVLLTHSLRQQLLDLDADYALRMARATTPEEKERIRRERDSQMNQLLGAAAINGGLLLVSLAGTAKQIKQINTIRSQAIRPEVETLRNSSDLGELRRVLEAHQDGSMPLNQHEQHVLEQRLNSLRRSKLELQQNEKKIQKEEIKKKKSEVSAQKEETGTAEHSSEQTDKNATEQTAPQTGQITNPPSLERQRMQTALGEQLFMKKADALDRFSDGQLAELRQLAATLSRDRRIGLRNLIENYFERGRSPDKVLELLNSFDTPQARGLFLEGRAEIRWQSNFRDKVHIEEGNLLEGWQHIDGRHVSGSHPGGAADLFAPGTTRAELEVAANEIVKRGNRLTDPRRRMQRFSLRMTIHGKSDNVEVMVDASDGRVITMFPMRGGQ